MRFAYPPYGPEPGILENYPRIFLKSQIFVYYSPVIPLISGNPVTSTSLLLRYHPWRWIPASMPG